MKYDYAEDDESTFNLATRMRIKKNYLCNKLILLVGIKTLPLNMTMLKKMSQLSILSLACAKEKTLLSW